MNRWKTHGNEPWGKEQCRANQSNLRAKKSSHPPRVPTFEIKRVEAKNKIPVIILVDFVAVNFILLLFPRSCADVWSQWLSSWCHSLLEKRKKGAMPVCIFFKRFIFHCTVHGFSCSIITSPHRTINRPSSVPLLLLLCLTVGHVRTW